MLAQSVNYVTLDKAPRPTKSEWDSADAKQAERSLKGKDVVLSKGMLSFYNGCGDGEVRCNGRGKQGKDALACVPKGFAWTQSQPSTHRPSPYEKRVR